MTDATTVFRTSVPVRRLRRAEKILQRLGLSTADAVNMLLAQIEIRQGLPFDVRMAIETPALCRTTGGGMDKGL